MNMIIEEQGVKKKVSLRQKFEYRTRRGVRIFKQPKVKDGVVLGWSKNYILAVKWGGRQYSFTLGPDKRESGSLADKIAAFLKVNNHTPEMVMEEFFPAKVAKKEQILALATKPATVGDVYEFLTRITHGHEHPLKQPMQGLSGG